MSKKLKRLFVKHKYEVAACIVIAAKIAVALVEGLQMGEPALLPDRPRQIKPATARVVKTRRKKK